MARFEEEFADDDEDEEPIPVKSAPESRQTISSDELEVIAKVTPKTALDEVDFDSWIMDSSVQQRRSPEGGEDSTITVSIHQDVTPDAEDVVPEESGERRKSQKKKKEKKEKKDREERKKKKRKSRDHEQEDSGPQSADGYECI